MSHSLRGGPAALLILLLASWAAVPACAASCADQLTGEAGINATTKWLDPATPEDACTAQLCTADHAACGAASPPLSTLQLVFSDEFNTSGQQFGVGAGNPRWTAASMWYGVTQDIEVYVPEQVTTVDGAAVLTIDRAGPQNATALSQQPGGVVWNVSSAFKSGLLDSWNKFCFTGGYMETRVQLPGNDFASGFWPAFWLMGNLGRAGHALSTTGFWPYTYDSCGGGDVGTEYGAGGPTPQNITACPDPPGFDRTKYGLQPGVGRGAPEIDLVEVMVGSSRRRKPGKPPAPTKPGDQVYPHTLLTLQTAPLLPNGTTWTVDGLPGPGQYLPQENLPEGMVTNTTYWKGPFTTDTDSRQVRPGNLYQDAVGAYASLDPSFWTSFHTFGLHWEPRQYVRWYIDGVLVYEVDQEALRAQTNASGYTTQERLIPVEPMYIIMNAAMSDSFGYVDLEKLQFPSQYKVDYVRVYQNASAVNLGCSPPDFPTQQYLACNRDKYLLTAEEQVLVEGPCLGAVSCRQEANVNLEGGDIPSGDGATYVQPQQFGTVKECCQACQAMPACGAYVYSTAVQTCYFKAPSGWTKAPVADPAWGALAGVVYEAGQSWPRGTNSSNSSGDGNATTAGGSGGNTTTSGGGGGGNTTTVGGGGGAGNAAGGAGNATAGGNAVNSLGSGSRSGSPPPVQLQPQTNGGGAMCRLGLWAAAAPLLLIASILR